MIQALRRTVSIYGALAEMTIKMYLAYSSWAWMQFIVQILSMLIFVYFWRAVYANTSTLGGLNLQQTLNYILLATVFAPLVATRVIFQFGFMIRSGSLAIALLIPTDFQTRSLVQTLAEFGLFLAQKIPLLFIAWFFFGLQLPANALTWLAFLASLILGVCILFYFDWLFACLAFYSTETWGLSVVREGVGAFFSGALVPLTMMPAWLQDIAAAMPFAQALYVPVSIFTSITPLAELPRALLVQIVWLIGLAVLSRAVFNIAIRQVTVQGG